MARTYGKFSDLITFTRASGGTALRPVSYGSELVTNGDFSDGAAGWSISGESTISAGVAVIYSSSGTVTKIRQIGFPVNKTLSITYTIKNYVAGGLNLGASGSYQVIPSTVGTHTVLMKTNSGELEINRQGGPTIITIDNISVKEVLFDQPNAPLTLFNHPVDIPRIEYDADGNRLGLLIEEARTNLVTYSEDLTTWSKTSGGAVVADQTIAPDGTQTADEISGIVYKSLNIGSDTRSFSVYLKASAGTTATVRIDAPAANTITVDLTDGSVVLSSGSSLDSYGVKDAGNGWYLCHIVVTASVNNYVLVGKANDASHTLYAWGAQLEVGAFPTSYIPTSGSTATRAADSASIPVSEFGYNDDEGSVVVEANAPVDSNQTRLTQLVTLGSSDNRVIDLHRLDNDIATYNGSVTIVGHPFNASNDIKAAAVYKSGSYALVSDGQTAETDSTQAVLNPNTLTLGMNGASARHLNGHIKSIKYYPRRLTNAQLQELTS